MLSSFWIYLLNAVFTLSAGVPMVHQVEDLQANIRWMTFINEDMDSLEACYDDQAIKILPQGDILGTRMEIVSHYQKSDLFVRAIKSLAKIQANEQRVIKYEIGSYVSDDQGIHKHIVIWQGSGLEERRVLEFVAKADLGYKSDFAELDQRRTRWMQLCNEHKVEQLVQEMYSEDPIYYNHKPPIRNTTDLIQEYKYMANPEYSLHLEPLHVEPVNDNLIYEIGQCSGSYGGKYLLIWERGLDGEWKILLDSNI